MAPADVSRRAGVLVGLWAAAVGALALNHHLVGVFYDDGLYAGIATALASGDGFAHPHLPAAPAVIHYPPVYPLVLAPLFGLFAVDTAGFLGKILNLVLAAAAAGLIAAHATRARLLGAHAPAWLPGALVAGAAAAVPVLTTQSVLFAEPLFAVLLAATVMLADRAVSDARPGLAPWAGVAAALVLLTRTIGIAAGAGAALFIFLSGYRRAAIRAAIPVGLAAAAWFAWTLVHRAGIDPALAINYGSYGEVLKQAGLGALGSSTLDLPRPLLAISFGWLGSLTPVLGLPAIAVGMYGLWLLGRRSSIGWSLAGYLLILAIWPFPADRFLWAVLPWLWLAFGAGVLELLRRRWLRVPAAVIAVAGLMGFVIYQAGAFADRAGPAPAISANFSELLPGLRELPADAVLAVDDEPLVWLYSGRRAVPLFLYGYQGSAVTRPEPAEHRAYLERQGVTHIVLASATSPSAAALRAMIGAFPDWLAPLRSWPGGRWIFAVRP